MTQLELLVNSLPRELSEFAFFLFVGYTAGFVGLIWLNHYQLKFFLKIGKLQRNNRIDRKIKFFSLGYILQFNYC